MTTARENLTSWLRDAYAMEGQAIELLEAQIKRLESYPEALPRLRQHLQETRQQQSEVEQCLHRLGSDPSTLKDAAMKLTANVQGMLHAMSGDEVLKHGLGSYAFENFEAASYDEAILSTRSSFPGSARKTSENGNPGAGISVGCSEATPT